MENKYPDWIKGLHHEISAGMVYGRLAMLAPEETTALARAVYDAGDLNHVEIGCLWGGTAIVAALVKQRAGLGGHIYTIDPMDVGFWEVGDTGISRQTPPMPTALKTLQNFHAFGVAHRISIIPAKSDPWPFPEESVGTILIDGDHSPVACIKDWDSATDRALERILVHDYDTLHEGVKAMVDTYAMNDFSFEFEYRAGCMMIFHRSVKPSRTMRIHGKSWVLAPDDVLLPAGVVNA